MKNLHRWFVLLQYKQWTNLQENGNLADQLEWILFAVTQGIVFSIEMC